MRLWLDGRKRIDLWPNRGPAPFSFEADFTAAPQSLRVEMNQFAMEYPKPRLSWSGPGIEAKSGPAGAAISLSHVAPMCRQAK